MSTQPIIYRSNRLDISLYQIEKSTLYKSFGQWSDTIAYQAKIKFDSEKIHASRYYRVKSECIFCLICIQACIKLYFHTCIEHVKLTGQSQVCIQVDTSILGNQPGFKPVYYWL